MASSFAALRAKQGNMLDTIKKREEERRGGGAKDPTLDDENYWNPTHVRNKDGSGEAIVRFLPAPQGEDDPYVKYDEYFVQGKGGWYINKSRTALGKNERDPAYEYNGEIFKTYKDKEERKKRLLNRRTWTTAQIKIISDPNAPENEGKIKKWKFGPQVWDSIDAAMFPEFATQKAINPFNPVNPDPNDPKDHPGANFHFRVYTKKIPNNKGEGMVEVPSYEKSGFSAPCPLVNDPEDFDAIWAQQFSLKEIIAESEFKSYDVLKKELDKALGLEKKNFLDEDDDDKPVAVEPKKKPEKKVEKPAETLNEALNDEVPFDVGNDSTETKASEFDGNADDDWFNELTK